MLEAYVSIKKRFCKKTKTNEFNLKIGGRLPKNKTISFFFTFLKSQYSIANLLNKFERTDLYFIFNDFSVVISKRLSCKIKISIFFGKQLIISLIKTAPPPLWIFEALILGYWFLIDAVRAAYKATRGMVCHLFISFFLFFLPI